MRCPSIWFAETLTPVSADNLASSQTLRYLADMTAKEQLRSLVDTLSEEEAATTLIVVERQRDDAMLQALAAAPLDDEESTDEEDRSAREATAEYHRGEATSSDQLKRELGLD